MREPLIVDMFAGGGGASVGIEMALGRYVDIAINHDEQAIAMHKVNHPNTIHLTEDIFKVNLEEIVKGQHVGLMWASPDCTHFSRAKGKKPRSNNIRMLPWAVHKHAKAIRPDVIICENVREIMDWGPLDDKGYPIPEERGKEYQRFIEAMEALGYTYQHRVLKAADYGAYTTRERWYAIFRCDGRPIIWPHPTHSEFPEITGLKPWNHCADLINWSDLGKSIFDRKKPLAEKTQRRIANGIKKFIIDNPEPYFVPEKEAMAFLIQYHSETKNDAVRGQGLEAPIQTIDTSNRYGLVTAFITKFYKSGTGQSVEEPLHTITTSPGHFGLGSAFLIKYYGAERDGQTMTSPLGTVVTKDRFGLASIVLDIKGDKYVIYDIFLRMLQPEELKLMQGFPEDYIIDHDAEWKPYPKVEQVARIGNSVVPIMAQKLVAANCGYMRVGNRHPNPRYENEDDGQIKFIV